jgi:hypothetical protein
MGVARLLGKVARKTLWVAAAYGGKKVAARIAGKVAQKVAEKARKAETTPSA